MQPFCGDGDVWLLATSIHVDGGIPGAARVGAVDLGGALWRIGILVGYWRRRSRDVGCSGRGGRRDVLALSPAMRRGTRHGVVGSRGRRRRIRRRRGRCCVCGLRIDGTAVACALLRVAVRKGLLRTEGGAVIHAATRTVAERRCKGLCCGGRCWEACAWCNMR